MAIPSLPLEGKGAPGPEAVLKELRAEYLQMHDMEMRMHHQRLMFMQTIDQWLNNQERFTVEQMNMLQTNATLRDNDLAGKARYRVEPQELQPKPKGNALGCCTHTPGKFDTEIVTVDESLDCMTTGQDPASQKASPRACPPLQPSDMDNGTHFEPPLPDDRECKASTVITVPGKTCEDPPLNNSGKESGCGTPEESQTHSMDLMTSREARELGRKVVAEAEMYMPTAKKRFKERTSHRSFTIQSKPTGIARIVLHPLFDSTCSFMILFNSVIIGISVEHLTSHPIESDFLIISGYVCSVFFFVELLLRMALWGKQFFLGENKGWHIFDFILVAISAVDFVSSNSFSSLRTLRMLRIIRVFRIFKFCRELSALALMIMDSMISLGWALILLLLIIYVFGICFTSLATEKMGGLRGAGAAAVQQRFGSLGSSVYSLVMSMLGGVSWEVCSDALMLLGPLEATLFFVYITFTILAVMNIITGVFVDNAVETARTQRDFLIQKELELKERYAVEMKTLFAKMDKDGSGTISLHELQQYLQDPQVQGYFAALGLDPNDAERLFKLLDDDGSGEVDVGEFLDGCIRLKGQARSIDVYAVMRTLKDLERVLVPARKSRVDTLNPSQSDIVAGCV